MSKPKKIDNTSMSHGRSPETGLMQAPEAAMRRAESIPLMFDASRAATEQTGGVVYDSWQQGPAIALRDVTDGHVRRLRLKAGAITLEVLAERQRRGWDFVARVYRGRKVAHDFVLTIGSRKVMPRSGGYYQWTSVREPRRLGLLSYDATISFDEVGWR